MWGARESQNSKVLSVRSNKQLGSVYGPQTLQCDTEEHLRVVNLGCPQRGRPSDPPFDHTSGAGYVAPHTGVYDDAIRVKNNSVQLAIISVFGAFGRQSQRLLKFYARRATSKKYGRDATRYSRYRRTTSYLSHHMQCLSTGIVMADAARILENVAVIKQRAASLPHM